MSEHHKARGNKKVLPEGHMTALVELVKLSSWRAQVMLLGYAPCKSRLSKGDKVEI